MSAALTYEVARPFRDEVGKLAVGEHPTADRVRGWKNLQCLIDMRYLKVQSIKDEAPKAKLSVVSKPEVELKPAAKPKKEQMCPKCGKGPFRKLAVHMMHKHKD